MYHTLIKTNFNFAETIMYYTNMLNRWPIKSTFIDTTLQPNKVGEAL